MFKLGICVVVLALFAASSMRAHDEAALLTDWSSPPPWPIFIAVNLLAGMLRAGADALTPPPIQIMDMATGYHLTMLTHVAQSKSQAHLLHKRVIMHSDSDHLLTHRIQDP